MRFPQTRSEQRWRGGRTGEGAGLWYVIAITTITIVITITTVIITDTTVITVTTVVTVTSTAGGLEVFPGNAPAVQGSRALPGGRDEGPGGSGTGLTLGAQGGTGEAEASQLLQSTWGLQDPGNYLGKTETKPGAEGWESPLRDRNRAWGQSER